MVLISITETRGGPAWLELQRQSQFNIQEEYSQKWRSKNILYFLGGLTIIPWVD